MVRFSDSSSYFSFQTYEKDSENMISYCGFQAAKRFDGMTSSDVLHIRFRTDDSLQYAGFNITFAQVQGNFEVANASSSVFKCKP